MLDAHLCSSLHLWHGLTQNYNLMCGHHMGGIGVWSQLRCVQVSPLDGLFIPWVYFNRGHEYSSLCVNPRKYKSLAYSMCFNNLGNFYQ
jgi:hypothetical protein